MSELFLFGTFALTTSATLAHAIRFTRTLEWATNAAERKQGLKASDTDQRINNILGYRHTAKEHIDHIDIGAKESADTDKTPVKATNSEQYIKGTANGTTLFHIILSLVNITQPRYTQRPKK